MLDKKIHEILTTEGAATFVTAGEDGPHMAATWNSYIEIVDFNKLVIPVGSLKDTERNITGGSEVQMILASRQTEGIHGQGAGFLLKGMATFENQGFYYTKVQLTFPWARAAMVFSPREIKQLI